MWIGLRSGDNPCITQAAGSSIYLGASLLLRQGVHPKVVSERLGHSGIAITMDTYSHVLPGMQEDAAALLARRLVSDDTHISRHLQNEAELDKTPRGNP